MTRARSPAAATDQSTRAARLLPAIAVAALAFGSNVSALANGFVFDDLVNVLQNPWVLQPARVWEAVTHNLAAFDPRFDTTYYRPVMHIVFAGCYAIAGPTPWVFHLVNVVAHVATSVGVYLLLSSWCQTSAPSRPAPGATGEPRVSPSVLLGAALFAVHPLHTEAVAWAAGIVDLSYSFFCVYAFVAATHRGRSPALRFALAPALLFLGLLSKEPALMLLPIVTAALLLRGDREDPRDRRRALLTVGALAAAFVAYLPLRVNALGGVMRGSPRVRVGVVEGIATALGLLGEYARMMVVPLHLSAVHDFEVVHNLVDRRAALGALALALLLGVTWLGRRRPAVVIGSAFLIFPLLPALYVPVLGEGLAAERYAYLPTVGLAFLVAAGVDAARDRSRGAAVACAATGALLVAVGAAMSFQRDVVWRDDITLWTDAVQKVPRSAAAHEYLGHAFLAAGRPDAAATELARAVALDSSRGDAHVNLASALVSLGRPEAAIAEARAGVQARPAMAEAQAVLGYSLSAAGRFTEAAEAYERALAINSSQASTHNLLAISYANLGRVDLAAAHFATAIRLDPGNDSYRANLALLSGTAPR